MGFVRVIQESPLEGVYITEFSNYERLRFIVFQAMRQCERNADCQVLVKVKHA